MGGALAQQVALAHPDRVDSLVLISTSPAVPGGPGRSELPPMSEDLRAYFAAEVKPDWSERTAVIEYLVGYERHLEAAEYFDEAHVRALVERIVDRTNDMAASMTNHALIEEGELARGRLDEIAAPALVIHGTADPLFPFGHGEALAREIPHADVAAPGGRRPSGAAAAVVGNRHRGDAAGARGRSPKPQFSIFSASCTPAATPVAGLARTTPISVRPFLAASNSRQCRAASV